MKKIIVGFLALALLLVGNSAFASTWNSDPDDCQVSLAVGNASTGVGVNNGTYGCWTLSSINATAGQSISLAVYYDNTSGINQDNVRVKLNQLTSGSSSTHSFNGSLVSNQGGTFPLGNVTINLSSAQTLTFTSVKWFPNNQNTTAYPLLGGQSGSEIINGNGLNIGTIVPTLPSSPTLVGQGSVIANFVVGSTQQQNNCTISNFTGNGSTSLNISSGNAVNLSWNTNDCTTVNVYGAGINSFLTNGNQTVYPTSSGNYVITASGPNGSAPSRTVYVNVNDTQNCYINNFTGNGSTSPTISSGDPLDLVWNTTGCTSVNVSGPNGFNSNSLDDSRTVYPTYSGTYTINAYGSSGSNQTRTVHVTVDDYNDDDCRITDFTVDNGTTAYIDSGDSVRIEWDTEDCTSVNVSGYNLNSNSLSGNRNVTLYNDATYTIYAYGYNSGTQSRTVRVYVDDEDNNNNCYINNFTANGSSNAYIQSGNPVNFVWNTRDCTSVNVSGPGLNSYQLNGYQTIYPTDSGTYRITAYGYNGSAPSRTVYVTVNPVIYTNSCAVTTVVTNVTQNSAILNGLVSGSTGNSYFEYGTTASLGSQTNPRMGNGSFSESITGLAPNTVYYFRLVSQCNGTLSYGKTELFQTFSIKTIQPVIVQGTTVIGTQSPIMLKIENRYQYISVGDTIDYTITYKNIGKSKLTNPILQVVIPKGITPTNSSAGTYQNDTNTLTVELEDLNPKDEGVVYLQGVVNSIDSTTAQVVTTAILVYTSPNGAQENAIAYVLNTPRGLVNGLGASAFWSGLWNMGLIGWLILAILILLIILLTRRYAGNKSVVHTTSPSGNSHTTTTTNY